jgi:multiple sugar transport system substrate-binding protein
MRTRTATTAGRPRNGEAAERAARRSSRGRLAAAGTAAALASLVGLTAPALAGSAAAQARPEVTSHASGCKASATKITFWAWVPGIDRAVTAFNKTHPSICVTLSDVGAGDPEYVKLAQAAKAGSGEPDVAEVEYDELPSFVITHSVINLVPYGANAVKNDFVPWVWKEVSQGSAVYAIPGDTGPMATYYNSALFAKYHLSPPATWKQFASDAATLKKDDPKAFITNFSATDLQWVMALMGQYNAWPFVYHGGSKLTIDFTGPRQMAFADYWQKLLSAHEVNVTTDVSTVSFTDLNDGTDALWLSSAWGPSYFTEGTSPSKGGSLGEWRAAPLPQWVAGRAVSANWGGSSYPVFSQSKHPAQAAEFAEWLNASAASWNITKTPPSSLFPSYKPLLDSSSFKNITVPLSGSSHPYVVFSQAAAGATFQDWPPIMTEALTDSSTAFAGVVNGTETLPAAFRSFQKTLVSYAKSQGFTVTT